MPEITQLRPPRADEIAERLEKWARLAREGELIGYSMVVIHPGGAYTCDGWQSKEANALQEIGMHITMALDIWRSIIKEG